MSDDAPPEANLERPARRIAVVGLVCLVVLSPSLPSNARADEAKTIVLPASGDTPAAGEAATLNAPREEGRFVHAGMRQVPLRQARGSGMGGALVGLGAALLLASRKGRRRMPWLAS
jgi:hypothetical protein